MIHPTQLKTKYKQEKEKLFKKLAKSNNGFYFNQKHTDLVDTIVKDIVSEINKTYTVEDFTLIAVGGYGRCLLYTSPSPRDLSTSRMPSSA